MVDVVAVALGGALGAIARYGLGQGVTAWFGLSALYGTLSANVLGSLFLGWLYTRDFASWMGVEPRVFLGVGVLGGFTTYSSFNQETLRLMQDGSYARASLYALGTLATCLGAGLFGTFLGRTFH